MRPEMMAEDLRELALNTRLYARSKGLALVGQGVAFMAGVLPLLYTLREAAHLPATQTAGLYAASGAFFLFMVWLGLKLVPDAVDRAYYMRIGDAHAGSPTTPDWARFVAPLCLLAPIFAVGVALLDAWQGAVLALVLFGIYMFVVGRFLLHEPATEIIGAVTVLLGGLVAAMPHLAFVPSVAVAQEAQWLNAVLHAQSTALTVAGWLGVAWAVSSIGVHFYNRWLLAEIGRKSGGYGDQ